MEQEWHLINWKDYIDGPFDSFESALAEAMFLGGDLRQQPRTKRVAKDFYEYRAPFDRAEKWYPTFWICTRESARTRGIPDSLFSEPRENAA